MSHVTYQSYAYRPTIGAPPIYRYVCTPSRWIVELVAIYGPFVCCWYVVAMLGTYVVLFYMPSVFYSSSICSAQPISSYAECVVAAYYIDHSVSLMSDVCCECYCHGDVHSIALP